MFRKNTESYSIKKVIARLCKCFAIFAVFLFVGVFAGQKVDAYSIKAGSGTSVSGTTVTITSNSSAKVTTEHTDKWGWAQWSVTVYLNDTKIAKIETGASTYKNQFVYIKFGDYSSISADNNTYHANLLIPWSKIDDGAKIKITSWSLGSCDDTLVMTIKDGAGPSAPSVNNPNANKWALPGYSISWGSSSDSISSVSKYQYTNKKSDGSNDGWKDLSGSSDTWTEQRNNDVCFRAVDTLGNAGSETCTRVKIDDTPPTFSVGKPTNGTVVGTTYYSKKKDSFSVTLGASGSFESLSKTTSIKYGWSTSNSSCNANLTGTRSNYVASLSAYDAEGTYYLCFDKTTLVDGVGKQAPATNAYSTSGNYYYYKFVISNAIPTVKVTMSSNLENNTNQYTSKLNELYYIKSASSSDYIYVNFEGKDLAALESTICSSNITVTTDPVVNVSITRGGDSKCNIKMPDNSSRKYTITVKANTIKTKSSIGNQQMSFIVIVDNKKPTIEYAISDPLITGTTAVTCNSKAEFCYKPQVSMRIVDTTYSKQNLNVELVTSSGATMISFDSDITNSVAPIITAAHFSDGLYSLAQKYYIRIENFTDLAGNYFCSSSNSHCYIDGGNVAKYMYISNVAPDVQIKYTASGESGTKTSSNGKFTYSSKTVTGIWFTDVSGGYEKVNATAKIAFLRGNPVSVTNKNEKYNTSTFMSNTDPSGTTGSDELKFQPPSLEASDQGYTFGAEVVVCVVKGTTKISKLCSTVYITYDAYAPEFKKAITDNGNSLQTTAQKQNASTKKWDIYISAAAMANTANIESELIADNHGFKGGTSSLFTTLRSMVESKVSYSYKINGSAAKDGKDTKVIASESTSQASGSVTITVTSNSRNSVCTVYYDLRAVSLEVELVNELNESNLYHEDGTTRKYYFVGVGQFKLKLKNTGSLPVDFPTISQGGKTDIVCKPAATGATALQHEGENQSCDVSIGSDYVGNVISIKTKNSFGLNIEVKIQIIALEKSFDYFVTSDAIPSFAVDSLSLKSTDDFITGDGEINPLLESGGSLSYTMYLDYQSYFNKSMTATITSTLAKPKVTQWKLINNTSFLTSSAVIGSTISGNAYFETITITHKLPGDSKMLGCVYNSLETDDSKKVQCNSTGTISYTLNIYYLRGNLEYDGEDSISVKTPYTSTLSAFNFKNGDCETLSVGLCETLKNGITPTNIVSKYNSLSVVINNQDVTINTLSGFADGNYDVEFTLNLRAYKIQTSADRITIKMTTEIFFYTTDLVFVPVHIETTSGIKYRLISNESNEYYISLKELSTRIYFVPQGKGVSPLHSINMEPGKEISVFINGIQYTSSDAFGVENGMIYLQLTYDMITALSNKAKIKVVIPINSFKINGSILNISPMEFNFVNDTSPAELPGTVNDKYNGQNLRVEIEHHLATDPVNVWNPLVLTPNEIYAVTYGDKLRLTLAIKEDSPLITLHSESVYNICTSDRKDLTSNKILLGNKEFTTCSSEKEGEYLIFTLTYDVNKTWNSEVKDISISNLIYDAAFNQIAYRSISLQTIIKVLPNAEVDSVIGFEKSVVYKDKDSGSNINYLNYDNTLSIKMAASDKTLFNYDKLTFDSQTTTYTIIFYEANAAVLTLKSASDDISFESDPINRKVLVHFKEVATDSVDFDGIVLEINDFYYDGARMSTVTTKKTLSTIHRFVTVDVISLGIADDAPLETRYMNEKSKGTYSYVNEYTGFNKEETYLYYIDEDTNKTPLDGVCDVSLNKTYSNDISYRVSNCRGEALLSNVGMHVTDKIGYEKDIPLKINIQVDNTNPTIGTHTQSKDDSSYSTNTLYYILDVGGTYYAYYLITIADEDAGFETGPVCEVSVPDSSKLLGYSPTCNVLSNTQVKVKFTLDTSVTAKSLRNEMSFDLKIQDRAGNSFT